MRVAGLQCCVHETRAVEGSCMFGAHWRAAVQMRKCCMDFKSKKEFRRHERVQRMEVGNTFVGLMDVGRRFINGRKSSFIANPITRRMALLMKKAQLILPFLFARNVERGRLRMNHLIGSTAEFTVKTL